MLCHMPTLTSVGIEVAKGTAAATLSSGNHGKSAKLRTLPVINAADEVRMTNSNGNGNSNGHKPNTRIEVNA